MSGVKTRHTSERLRAEQTPEAGRVRNMVRRMIVDRTRTSVWRLIGHLQVGEKPLAETYSGIGFYARPPDGVDAEVIVANLGGAGAPVIVASRDEDTRRTMADLAADETATFNSQTIVKHTAGGLIEARSKDGTAVALATKADLEELRAWIAAEMVIACPAGSSTPGTVDPPPTPAGTTVLKGE